MTLLAIDCATGLGDLYVGQQIARRSVVTDEHGVLTDSTMSWSLKVPLNPTPVTGTPDHESVGTYITNLPTFTVPGIYHLLIQASGPVYEVDVVKFRVKPTGF